MDAFEFPSSQSVLPLPGAFEEPESLGPLPPEPVHIKDSSLDRYKLTGTLRQFSTDDLLNKAFPDLQPQIEALAASFYIAFKTRTFPFEHPDAETVLGEWAALQLKVVQMKFQQPPAPPLPIERKQPASGRRACQKCYHLKQKCDHGDPCSNCVRFKRECRYQWESVSPSPRPVKRLRPPPLSPFSETETETESEIDS